MQFDTIIRIPSLEEEERDAFYESDYGRFSHDDRTDSDTMGGDAGGLHGEDHLHQPPLELSYERDSRWKPHLSWSHLSWKLQQRMEEQAIQRELAWQKIADKLGPLLISSDGGLTFGQATDYTLEGVQERAQERTPFYSQKLSYSSQHINKQQLSQTNSSHATTNKLSQTNSSQHNQHHHHGSHDGSKHDKARRRFMTVSGILIALIFLLFTIVVLMALGILHR